MLHWNRLGVTRIFTHPQDPAFNEGYADFLVDLGYGLDATCSEWWSKYDEGRQRDLRVNIR